MTRVPTWTGTDPADAFECGRIAGQIEASPVPPVRALPVPVDRSRIADTMAQLREIAGLPARPSKPSGIAQAIAADLGGTIRDAVSSAVPYGRSVEIEADIGHHAADGSRTAGRVRITVGGRD
jgi:hypothetical protein